MTNTFLGGWQVGYIFKAQSGAPLGFGNFLFAEGMGVDDIMADDPTVDQWFNVNAFNRVSAQQLVSNVRTQPSRFEEVRGPGYAVLDLVAARRTSASAAAGRCSSGSSRTTLLNRANLQNPNTTVTSTALGTITAQNGLPRQLAARGEGQLLNVSSPGGGGEAPPLLPFLTSPSAGRPTSGAAARE